VHLFLFIDPYLNRDTAGSWQPGTELCTRIIGKFKESRDLAANIDNQIQLLHNKFSDTYDTYDVEFAQLLKLNEDT
jgi:hypothetical protein